ncbi:MAG: potassium channel protein [Thermodesulfobacteriota bacterium]|nr:potassium channel protein [Thermodesulfobacteriota bacterium]
MVPSQSRNILIGITILIFVIAFGTSGYMLIEKWDFLDALYMTVITLTTVGYGEVRPLGGSGRVFTICLLIMGVGFVFYMFGTITQIMVEGQFRRLLGRRKLEKQLAALKDHYIICGYGRIGQIISREIAKKPLPLVIIENSPDLIKTIEEQGHLFIEGDATREDTLLKANIQKAKGLVATVSSDADNVYIILTARGLNPGLYIMARVVDEKAERNLLQAGANRVISPYHIGARKMAQAILRPAVTDFIELAVHRGGIELQIEEIPVRAPSRITDVPLRESGIRQELGLIIIAIQRASGEMLYNPPPEARIQVGDTLIAMGSPESLGKLEKMVGVAEM